MLCQFIPMLKFFTALGCSIYHDFPPELISVFLLAVKVSNQWRPVVTGSGHFDEVEDLGWDTSGGQFVVSVSKDQTTRLHAPTTYKQGQVCKALIF